MFPTIGTDNYVRWLYCEIICVPWFYECITLILIAVLNRSLLPILAMMVTVRIAAMRMCMKLTWQSVLIRADRLN